jgi:hypothetical protein
MAAVDAEIIQSCRSFGSARRNPQAQPCAVIEGATSVALMPSKASP